MMCRRPALAWMFIALASPGVLQAQGANGQDRVAPFLDLRDGVSLDAAVARAVAQEPGLRAARLEVDVARGTGLRSEPLSQQHRPLEHEAVALPRTTQALGDALARVEFQQLHEGPTALDSGVL